MQIAVILNKSEKSIQNYNAEKSYEVHSRKVYDNILCKNKTVPNTNEYSFENMQDNNLKHLLNLLFNK